jgi:hypothetical protein
MEVGGQNGEAGSAEGALPEAATPNLSGAGVLKVEARLPSDCLRKIKND